LPLSLGLGNSLGYYFVLLDEVELRFLMALTLGLEVFLAAF